MANPRIPYQLSSARTPAAAAARQNAFWFISSFNVENWQFDQPMPRTIITARRMAARTVPDVPNFSWADYGMRARPAAHSRGLCFAAAAGLDQLQRRRDRRIPCGSDRDA